MAFKTLREGEEVGKTTVNIPSDVSRLINRIKKNRPGSTQTGILMELVRLGAEKSILIELLEKTEMLEDKISKLSEPSGVDKSLKMMRGGLTHVLCIVRRFADKHDAELLKIADNDAAILIGRAKE